MRRKVSDLKKARHCTRRPDILDRSGKMEAFLPPVPRTQPELSPLSRLQMGWKSLPQMETTWMWMDSELTTTLKGPHSRVPGWPVQARIPTLHGQTRHFRVPGCPATLEHHGHERRCDSQQLETSPAPFGPWLKTPAQAEPGGEWFKLPPSLVCQLRRTLTTATLLNRAYLREVILPCQARLWMQVPLSAR
eukprot:5480664-Amphidinium_carterae.1